MKIELTEKETEILCEYLDDLICNDDFMDQKGMEDYNEKLDVLKSIREKMVLHNYYFTFGSDPKFPFYKGYLIVKAESINVACDKFEKKYPGSLPYTINCSAYYTEDRRRYEAALNAITDEEKKKVFMEEWQDGRTSMKNIGEYAHQLGEKLKGKVKCCIDDTTKVDT